MKVSIVTVTKNSAATLQDCFDSINSQTYNNIEHIVVDGNSNDGTLDLIKSNSNISTFISEDDVNLYDAMNKGIDLCTGDIIGILNSDDVFDNNNVVKSVVETIGDNDAVYADLCYVSKDNVNKIIRYWKAGEISRNSFKNGWMPPHPTLFIKNSIYSKFGGFNIKLSNSADYELILRFFHKHKIKVKYLPKTLVRMRVGGISNKSIAHRIKANKEDRISWQINNLNPSFLFSFFKPLRKIPQFFNKPEEHNNYE